MSNAAIYITVHNTVCNSNLVLRNDSGIVRRRGTLTTDDIIANVAAFNRDLVACHLAVRTYTVRPCTVGECSVNIVDDGI